jgi:hypothetical protein
MAYQEQGGYRLSCHKEFYLHLLPQRKMAEESAKMVVDTQTRLTTAVAELRDLVVGPR